MKLGEAVVKKKRRQPFTAQRPGLATDSSKCANYFTEPYMKSEKLFVAAIVLASQAAGLSYTAPTAWQTRAASSSMRVAEFIVPRAAGDAEDAEVIIYFFGGTGGSVEANIDRWVARCSSPTAPPRRTRRGAGRRP